MGDNKEPNCDEPYKEDFPIEFEELVNSIIKKEGFTNYSVEKICLPADGRNFLSRLYTVSVKGKTKEGDKQTDIFLKRMIPVEKMEATLNVYDAYAAELYFYKELSKIFKELEDEFGLSEEEKFKIIKSYDESTPETLILENLTAKGYETCQRTYVATLHVAELCVKELAKFHGLSFVLEVKRPDYYSKKVKVRETPLIFNEESSKSALHIMKMAIKYITEESRMKVETLLPSLCSKWEQYTKDATKTKCCLCHGDMKLTNMLMKHKGSEVTDAIMIDYQLSYYGCPINDLLFFIFTGTDQEFRRRHLQYLKDYYYRTLGDFLEKFALDLEEIYPREDFENDFKDRLDYGLLSAMYFLPFFLAVEGEIPDLGDKPIAEMEFGVMDEFAPRLQGIVDDFISWESWGYL